MRSISASSSGVTAGPILEVTRAVKLPFGCGLSQPFSFVTSPAIRASYRQSGGLFGWATRAHDALTTDTLATLPSLSRRIGWSVSVLPSTEGCQLGHAKLRKLVISQVARKSPGSVSVPVLLLGLREVEGCEADGLGRHTAHARELLFSAVLGRGGVGAVDELGEGVVASLSRCRDEQPFLSTEVRPDAP